LQRFFKFIVVFWSIVSFNKAEGQFMMPARKSIYSPLNAKVLTGLPFANTFSTNMPDSSLTRWNALRGFTTTAAWATPTSVLSENYYATHLAFFCRQELKFQKLSGIPFRFRVGSLEQANKLEGK
jgi:hypothetical protein